MPGSSSRMPYAPQGVKGLEEDDDDDDTKRTNKEVCQYLINTSSVFFLISHMAH
jgi:hypothetical protein